MFRNAYSYDGLFFTDHRGKKIDKEEIIKISNQWIRSQNRIPMYTEYFWNELLPAFTKPIKAHADKGGTLNCDALYSLCMKPNGIKDAIDKNKKNKSINSWKKFVVPSLLYLTEQLAENETEKANACLKLLNQYVIDLKTALTESEYKKFKKIFQPDLDDKITKLSTKLNIATTTESWLNRRHR